MLDNCEHVIGMVPELAALLGALPDLQVLATSQAPLHLSAELVVALDALDDADALALVARVATRRHPGISVGGRDRNALIELIHLLDGLPLALEVAAARLTRSPCSADGAPARLTRCPGDDRSDRPARQRSLRATVQWSLRLLDPATETLFARLGAFAGPVELEELEVVCGAEAGRDRRAVPAARGRTGEARRARRRPDPLRAAGGPAANRGRRA